MKWSKELEDKLVNLINLGKRYDEISLIIGTTPSAIKNKCYKLGLSVVYYEEHLCKECSKLFFKLIKSKQLFCCKSCATTYNNRGTVQSDITKNKISNTLINKSLNRIKIKKIRSCKHCTNNVDGKKLVCKECKKKYYEYYRPLCEFSFNLSDYPDEFEFSLIEQYGWYKPKNRGDNLGGISRDHMYSVRDGFINKIDYNLIKHPANCKLMLHSKNNIKNNKSSITFDDLINRIKKWEIKYGKK